MKKRLDLNGIWQYQPLAWTVIHADGSISESTENLPPRSSAISNCSRWHLLMGCVSVSISTVMNFTLPVIAPESLFGRILPCNGDTRSTLALPKRQRVKFRRWSIIFIITPALLSGALKTNLLSIINLF